MFFFHFCSNSNTTFFRQNSGDPDQTPGFAASDRGLHCLPTSRKRDAMLIYVNKENFPL